MKKQTLALILVLMVPFLFSCMGQHNQAPSKGVHLDDERIYGPSRQAEPRQLANSYPEDPKNVERAQKIREKFFPR